MTPFIPLLHKRAARRRKRILLQPSSPPAPPPAVTILQALDIDGFQVQWTFSAAVLSYGGVAGLLIGGVEPDSVVEITPDGALTVRYDAGIFTGDDWLADGNAGLSLTFDGGGILELPESGSVA